MQRKRNRNHTKTVHNSDWEKNRQFQRQLGKVAAKSYWDYLNNHIGDNLKQTQNNSGHSLKQTNEEGIPTLQTNGQTITNN